MQKLEIVNYKSLQNISIEFGDITVIRGGNGTGKSSIYGALELLKAISNGNAAALIASHGGINSIMFSGLKEPQQSRLKMSVEIEDLRYDVELGLPPKIGEPFPLDPEFKYEALGTREHTRIERKGLSVKTSNRTVPANFDRSESMLSHLSGLSNVPEISVLRKQFSDWRFYDRFVHQRDLELCGPRYGTFTASLASDGNDIHSAISTIKEIGNWQAFSDIISTAFPNCAVDIVDNEGILETVMNQPDILRPIKLRELSDGTIQFIMLTAALLQPRPSPLIVLNEPERSLNDTMIHPLCELIYAASQISRIIVITHNSQLSGLLSGPDTKMYSLEKINGATEVVV